MIRMLDRLARGEKGQVFIIVLVMLLFGSLIIPPTISLMETGLSAGQAAEQRTLELYGADAGVETAVQWLKVTAKNSPNLLPKTTTAPAVIFPTTGVFTINDNNVFAFLKYYGKVDNNSSYVITAVAGPNVIASTDLASQPVPFTKVVSYTADVTGDFIGITQSVITSQGGYSVSGGQSSIDPPPGEENGPVEYYTGPWPTPSVLSAYYWLDVADTTPYSSSNLDVNDYPGGIGPFYRDGTIDISNSANGTPIFRLNGTTYITGDTLIGLTAKDFILDLNGNTLYVESPTAGNQYALRIGVKCNLTGSGAIIAVGNIEFKPSMASSPSDYILVLSVTGKTYMQPNGNFYGTLAGSTEVDLQNGSITWTDPSLVGGSGINLPGYRVGVFWGIKTWNIATNN